MCTVSSPMNVTVSSPMNVTVSSPMNVTVSSPVNVTKLHRQLFASYQLAIDLVRAALVKKVFKFVNII